MEQLDLVYNTLTSLEKNYHRSKKSRSEYVKEKFGGDIGIGSFLILNALQAAELSDPEDVKKLSAVRRIIDNIKDNEDNLDAINSFDFDNESMITAIHNSLVAGLRGGQHIKIAEQSEFYATAGRPLHYKVSPNTTTVVPVNSARYFRVVLPAWAAVLSGGNPEAFADGGLVERDPCGDCHVAEKVVFDD